MREFWAFIGGVAVGILAVTGVFAMEEDGKHRSVESDEDELDELEDDTKIEPEREGRLIVRIS